MWDEWNKCTGKLGVSLAEPSNGYDWDGTMPKENLQNVKEVAKYFGVPVSRIYNMIFRKELPYIKIGRSVRFCRPDLEKYLEGLMIKPQIKQKDIPKQ